MVSYFIIGVLSTLLTEEIKMTDLQFKQIMNQIFHAFCAVITTFITHFIASDGISGLLELSFCILLAILAFYHCLKVGYISN